MKDKKQTPKPVEYYIDALRHIDLIAHPEWDTYNEWTGIIWGARELGIPQEIVEEWSSQSPIYDPKVFAEKWPEKSDAKPGEENLKKKAKECGWDEQAAFDMYCRDGYALDWSGDPWADGWIDENPEPPKKTAANIHKTERYAALPEHPVIWRAEDMEPLEIPEPEDLEKQREQCLQSVFRADEYVRYVTKAQEKKTEKEIKWNPTNNGHFEKTAGDILAQMADTTRLDPFGEANPKSGVWIGINPLDGKGTCDRNVTDHRLVLVESDHMPLEVQHAYYKAMRLPVMACIHSGGKSLHAWVRIEAGQDKTLYDARVSKLYSILAANGFIVDRANKNPSRLSRFPGFVRGDGCQYAFQAPEGCFESWDEWEKWIDELEHKTKCEVLGVPEAEAQPDPQELQEVKPANPGEVAFTDPIPLEDAFSSEFKAEWIPEPYRAYAVDAARSLCQPVEEVALALMCAVSYVGSKVFKIEVKGVQTHINLMLLMAADPSEKKSSCLTKAKSLIINFEKNINEKLKPKKRIYDDRTKINNARIGELRNKVARAQNALLLDDEKPIKKPDGKLETREEVRERLDNLVTTGLAKIAQLTEENEAMSRISCERDYLIDSSTVEGIRDALIDTNERMGIFSDEGGLFKIMGGLYTKGGKNADTDVIKKAWDGSSTSVRRAGTGAESRKFKLYEPLLTICLYVQPHVVMEAFSNKEFDEEGLLARFLISKPNMEPYRKKLGIRQNPVLRQHVEAVFLELIDFTDRIMFGDPQTDDPVPTDWNPYILKLSSQAEELFHRYFDTLEDRARSKEGRLHKSIYRKHAFTTLRVIAALHLMKEGANARVLPVTFETVQSGIEMGEYFLSGYFAVRGGSDAKARFMAEYIIESFQSKTQFKKRPDKVKWRDIHQACKGRAYKTEEIRMGINYLTARGWLVPLEEARAESYAVNPAIYTYELPKVAG